MAAYQHNRRVKLHIANSITPEESHHNWMTYKLNDGWKYGPVKDGIKKEHPCLVPYELLPSEQKAKDYIFIAIIEELKNI
jgi:hypothetical protein